MNRKSTVQLHLIPVLGSSLEKHAVAMYFLPLLVELGSSFSSSGTPSGCAIFSSAVPSVQA